MDPEKRGRDFRRRSARSDGDIFKLPWTSPVITHKYDKSILKAEMSGAVEVETQEAPTSGVGASSQEVQG